MYSLIFMVCFNIFYCHVHSSKKTLSVLMKMFLWRWYCRWLRLPEGSVSVLHPQDFISQQGSHEQGANIHKIWLKFLLVRENITPSRPSSSTQSTWLSSGSLLYAKFSPNLCEKGSSPLAAWSLAEESVDQKWFREVGVCLVFWGCRGTAHQR